MLIDDDFKRLFKYETRETMDKFKNQNIENTHHIDDLRYQVIQTLKGAKKFKYQLSMVPKNIDLENGIY